MKRFSEQFHKESKSIKLKTDEKRELRERLTAYMEYHPLPAELRATKQKKGAQPESLMAEPFKLVSFPFALMFKSSAVAAALVLVVIPFLAEKAVPGDTLYAVKVQFNEEVRGSLTFNSYQKVEWETERLNRRIAEARLLASEGRLTEAVEAEVAQAVRTHTENAQKEIEVLRAEDADDAAIAEIALDTTLEVQSASLKKESTDEDSMEGEEELVRPNLIADVIDASRSETSAKNASSTPPGYVKLMARAEQNTTRIYELRDTIAEFATKSQLTEVNRRIEDIDRAVNEAIELAEAEEQAARAQLVDVLQRSQKLIVYMTEIEVIETIDIETLVPVVLTAVEEEQAIVDLTEAVNAQVARLEELATQVEDESLLEKVDLTLTEVEAFRAELASTTEFAQLQKQAENVLELTNDIITTLALHLVPQEPEVIVPDTSTSTSSTTPEIPEEEEGETDATSTEPVEIEEPVTPVASTTTEPAQSTTTVDTE